MVPEEASALHFLEDAKTYRRPAPASEPKPATPEELARPREGDNLRFDNKYYSRDTRRRVTDPVCGGWGREE